MSASIDHKRHRILLVDDHPVVLAGLKYQIGKQTDLVCCGQATTLALARQLFETNQPDLIILDLRLPDGDSMDFIREITALKPSVPILVVSQCDELVYAERILKSGAQGYLMKSHSLEEVVGAIYKLIAGEVVVSPKVSALALHDLAGRKRNTHPALGALTNRELQVFQLLGAGIGSRAISIRLKLSIKTVDAHRENIKRKLGIRDAVGLVHYATHWLEDKDQTHKNREISYI